MGGTVRRTYQGSRWQRLRTKGHWWRVAGWLALALYPLVGAAQAAATGQPPASWRLELSEEFSTPGDSSQLAGRWQFAYPWGRTLGGSETEYYLGTEVNVRGGELLLTAQRLPQPLAHTHHGEAMQLRYTTGMIYGLHPATDSLRPAGCPPGTGLSFGWYEMRCRQPRDIASFPAFWLYGVPDELDIAETQPSFLSNNVHLNPHEYWRQGAMEQTDCQCFFDWQGRGSLATGYHRYALEWLPNQLTFYFDGVPIRRETRFVPLGCQQTLIANLAQWAWAGEQRDTLAIDYIRVYRPRQPLAVPFGSPGFEAVKPTIYFPPRVQAPEYTSLTERQTWGVVAAAGRLHLALQDNLNPACASRMPLPLGPEWRAPWRLGWRTPPTALQAPATQAVAWALLDSKGQLYRQGECPAGRTWQLPADVLPPGAYYLRLRVGALLGYQPVYVLDRSAEARPSAEWLQPLPEPVL